MKVSPCSAIPSTIITLSDVKKDEGVYKHPSWPYITFITLVGKQHGSRTTLIFNSDDGMLTPLNPTWSASGSFKKLDATVCFEIKENTK